MRREKIFGQRTGVSREVKSKIFLVFEGEKTEVKYFEGVREAGTDIGLSQAVEIHMIFRSAKNQHISHPKRILEMLERHVGEVQEGITYLALEEKIGDFLIYDEGMCEGSLVSKEDLCKEIKGFFENCYPESSDQIVEDIKVVVKHIGGYLEEKYGMDKIADRLECYIEEAGITIDLDIDKLCIIVDRDRGSFKDLQYERVCAICRERGYNLFVSNPCFELWLLLHHLELKDLNSTQLKENRKVSKRTYTERKLLEVLATYNKCNLRFSDFQEKIQNAITNAASGPVDVGVLKESSGTNVGELMRLLMSGGRA